MGSASGRGGLPMGVCIQRGLPRGDCIQGVGEVCIQRGLPRGDCIQGVGVCIQRRVCIQEAGGLHPEGGGGWADHPPIGYHGIWQTSGRYASYWNAFLLK